MIRHAIVVAFALLWWIPSWGAEPQAGSPPTFPTESLAIQKRSGGQITLSVELATTPDQQTYGLMFRDSMAKDHGMFFIFDPPRPTSFWMENTHIPLDMLFVRADGIIVKIVPNAPPYSREMIPSEVTVKGVLEINGGEADNEGIKQGDRLIYPGFGR